MIDRDAVRNNAKYLRNVRPVDPEEVSEYVEGTPHPAVVRRVLREEAFDLGLVETAEGTFVPVTDDPVPRADWAPEALPEPYARTLEDALVEEYGADWHRGESGDELREAIRRLKADYYFGNDVEYDRTAAFGYAVYHLADYYAAVGYVLDDLARNGHLPRRLRVLDAGAGVGGPALGLHDYLPEDALVDYHAIEPSPAADLLDRFLEGTRTGFHTAIHRTTAEATGFSRAGTDLGRDDEPWDLVVFGNVLSELDEPVPVVRDALDALAPDGSVVALAPADRNTSTGLREIERAVAPPEGEVTVYSPTLRLWPHEAPEDGGWTFATEPDLAVPPFQRRLDEPAAHGPDEAGRLREPGTGAALGSGRRQACLGRARRPVGASSRAAERALLPQQLAHPPCETVPDRAHRRQVLAGRVRHVPRSRLDARDRRTLAVPVPDRDHDVRLSSGALGDRRGLAPEHRHADLRHRRPHGVEHVLGRVRPAAGRLDAVAEGLGEGGRHRAPPVVPGGRDVEPEPVGHPPPHPCPCPQRFGPNRRRAQAPCRATGFDDRPSQFK